MFQSKWVQPLFKSTDLGNAVFSVFAFSWTNQCFVPQLAGMFDFVIVAVVLIRHFTVTSTAIVRSGAVVGLPKRCI